jgi:hypothetical protein
MERHLEGVEWVSIIVNKGTAYEFIGNCYEVQFIGNASGAASTIVINNNLIVHCYSNAVVVIPTVLRTQPGQLDMTNYRITAWTGTAQSLEIRRLVPRNIHMIKVN